MCDSGVFTQERRRGVAAPRQQSRTRRRIACAREHPLPAFCRKRFLRGVLFGLLFGVTFAGRYLFAPDVGADNALFVVVGTRLVQKLVLGCDARKFLRYLLQAALGILPKALLDDLICLLP